MDRATERALLPVLLLTLPLLVGFGCRPDPYALALRMIQTGEPMDLGDGRTLTVERKEGEALYGVRIEGPAESCDGTMVMTAPEARLERPSAEETLADDPMAGAPRLVFEQPVVVERCGEMTHETRHRRLTVALDALL